MAESTPSSELSDAHALRQILDVTRRLAAPTELPAMLGQVLEAAKTVLAADRGSLFLYDAARQELFTTIADGTQEIRFSVDKGIGGQCARTRCIVNVPDCYCDPRFNPQVDRDTGYRTNNLIAVPLVGLEDQLVGVMQLLNAARGRFDERDEHIAAALGSQAAVAIQRAMLMEERLVKLKLENDLALAREIQQDVLPAAVPVIPGYAMAAFAEPADQTGGDIYDLIPLPLNAPRDATPQSLVILLADATGHGVGPALSVTQARAMLRLGLRMGGDLGDLVTHINAQVNQDLSSRRFITAFIGKLDPTNHRVFYQSAGQGPLLHLRGSDGHCVFHPASTIPLGVLDELPIDGVDVIDLAPGDMLVLLTDGFYEARNPQSEQWGDQRVGQYLASVRHEPVDRIMEGLVAELRRFTHDAPPQDDLTAVILRRDA